MEHIVAISGGKDSVAMALRLAELNPETKYTYTITPTGDELPEMVAHWAKLEKILGPLTSINDVTLDELIEKKKALPNFRMRFCTVDLKIKPFLKYMKALSPDAVMYVGLRADEEGRLGIIDSEINVEYSMREWGWGVDDVWSYLKFKGIVIPERTDCGCCFFQRLPEWKNLLEKHPERFEHYASLERKHSHTFRSPSRDTWPASLDGLKKEIESGRKMINRKPKAAKKCRFCTM